MNTLWNLVWLLIIGVFVASVPTIYSVQKLNTCLTESIASLDQDARTAKMERWSKEEICMSAKSIVSKLQTCYQESDNQIFPPVSLVESIAKTLEPNTMTLSEMVEVHNKSCTNYPKYLIDSEPVR